jgi:hypothetical protein
MVTGFIRLDYNPQGGQGSPRAVGPSEEEDYNHYKLQSLETVSSTALVVHWDQPLHQFCLAVVFP